jgi:hypothetical protein
MSARFVVDNSVVMSWCFEDEGNGYAEAVLESLEDREAFVPAIWPLEVENILLVAEESVSARLHTASSSGRFAHRGRTGNSRADAQETASLAREHRLT